MRLAMEDAKYEALRLDNQLCFPLYACARDIMRKYKPFLDEIGLTYTQYITMMVLWEHRQVTSKQLGEKLYLDSGTLTPVLKSLEAKGYVRRYRSTEDERVLLVEVTEAGKALREEALSVPAQMACHVVLSPEESLTLYKLLYKLLSAVE